MEWLIVIGLIIAGLGLMIVELIFIPGTTVVGLIGLGLYVFGVFLSFDYFGNSTGWTVLLTTATVTLIMTIYALKSRAWERFALKNVNKSRVNEDIVVNPEVGMEGVSISSIKPMGKAEFDNREFEVRSMGNYIEENKPIKVIKIDNNRIFVEQLNTN